jgi:hypothetical protein
MPPVHKRLHIHLDATVVLATKFHGGEYRQGKDSGRGCFGLGVVLVAHRLEGVVYDAKGRHGVREHSGHYFFWPRGR